MVQVRTQFPYHVKVIENFWISMPDGTRLAAKGWFPEGPDLGPVPAVLEYLPYRKRDGTRTRDQGLHMYLAGHGYASIRLDIRGTGDSEGLITDEYTEQEQLDGCDAIAWIAAQDWCDGQVAMIGISWGGFNGLQIAARQPPALKTVITVGSTDDRYATDVHWIGGCLSKDNFDWSATMFAHNDLPPDPAIAGDVWRSLWLMRIRYNEPWIINWLKHQRRDDYWKQGSVCEAFSRITIPVYAVSGWADNYSESVPRLLAGLTSPRLGLIGPWAHSYPHNTTVEPGIGWLQEVLRWCGYWLKGQATGIMDEPLLRAWMQDGLPPSTCYRERPGRWVAETEWPSAHITQQRRYLSGSGRLQEQRGLQEVMTICSPLWVGLGAGEVGRYGNDAEWPVDQREDDGGSLVFVSEPLLEPLEILGAPLLHLTLSSNQPQALVCARLNDVAPDGRSTRVTVGLLNLSHRESHENPTPLVIGQQYEVTVELDDIAHAFTAGHRIAISISTSYWPIAWPSPELVTLYVTCGESCLTLPVRPIRDDDARLRPFAGPESAPQTPVTYSDVPQPHRRRICRDLLTGKMTVEFPRWTYCKEMPDIGQKQTSHASAVYEITDGDPLSATALTDYRVEMLRNGTTITHHSTGRMTCSATHFIIEVDLSIREDGVEMFQRQWHETIARDMV